MKLDILFLFTPKNQQMVVRTLIEFLNSILYYTRPYPDVFFYYIYLLFMGRTKPLPIIENDILLMSAVELAEKIRKKELTSEEVVRAYVERAKAVQPHINAITDARYEDALEDAKEIDKFLAKEEKSIKQIEKDTPLLGIPFSCKEAIGIKGLSQTAGICAVKTRKADEDSDAASLYRDAGAIPLTVTNVPEMCLWWDSTNLNFGKCRNPYDNHRTVGGSSGGEGALLTSAGALIGIGNDIGGSIRMPSAFNGIFGHKPSSGIISNGNQFPSCPEEEAKIQHLFSTGPMCRYAEDLPLLMKILSEDDKRLHLHKKVNFSHISVYYMVSFPGKLTAIPAIQKAVRKAAAYFEVQFGINAIPLRIDELEMAFPLWECKYIETESKSFATCLAGEKGQINLWWELLKSIFGLGNHTIQSLYYGMIERQGKDKFYYECVKKYDKVRKKFQDIFEEGESIVLLPTHPELPPFYHLTIPKLNNIGYTAVFNPLGYPVTSVPAGICDGVPIGLQVVSGHLMDHLTIAAALELEKCFGGWKGPSAISII